MFYFAHGGPSSRRLEENAQAPEIRPEGRVRSRLGHGRRRNGADHLQSGHALFPDATGPNDSRALEDRPPGLHRDAEVAERPSRKPTVERELNAGGAHVEGRRGGPNRREDFDLRVGRPTGGVASFVRLDRGSNLGVLPHRRRWFRAWFAKFGAHARPAAAFTGGAAQIYMMGLPERDVDKVAPRVRNVTHRAQRRVVGQV